MMLLERRSKKFSLIKALEKGPVDIFVRVKTIGDMPILRREISPGGHIGCSFVVRQSPATTLGPTGIHFYMSDRIIPWDDVLRIDGRWYE